MTAKTYRGNAPGDGWGLLGTTLGWQVHARPSSGPWLTVKVVATVPTKRKANYWLGWDGSRLASHKDALTMATHRPDLMAAVRDLLVSADEGRDLL